MSIQAYQRAATRAESPREIEYRAFGVVTAALSKARELGHADLGVLAHALQENRRLWRILATDCADDSNTLDPAVRARIISLALFVDRHSSAVLRDGADIEPLIDINRSMMEGLSGR
ncbi:MAG: flagellar biosynthesis regulator FlaF [Hyphomonadaceae bacterium]|nr:flagellar biosynthesis regulator FlaF [Hyphomonadaceae bacterium]